MAGGWVPGPLSLVSFVLGDAAASWKVPSSRTDQGDDHINYDASTVLGSRSKFGTVVPVMVVTEPSTNAHGPKGKGR